MLWRKFNPSSPGIHTRGAKDQQPSGLIQPYSMSPRAPWGIWQAPDMPSLASSTPSLQSCLSVTRLSVLDLVLSPLLGHWLSEGSLVLGPAASAAWGKLLETQVHKILTLLILALKDSNGLLKFEGHCLSLVLTKQGHLEPDAGEPTASLKTSTLRAEIPLP